MFEVGWKISITSLKEQVIQYLCNTFFGSKLQSLLIGEICADAASDAKSFAQEK